MRKQLKIGGIYIDLTYQYSDYFSDKIDAYISQDINQTYKVMAIEIKDFIEKPDRPVTFTYKNRQKMVSDKDTYIMTLSDDGDIKHLIYYTNDYQTIKIVLNSKIGQRLAELEYVISGMLFFEMALMEGYLPVHASCIHYKNHTFLLSGPSKSGKSTQTNFFIDLYKSSLIINEDKPLVYFENQKAFVIGSPWSGKHVINENMKKPLDHIFFIQQAQELSIDELSKNEKIKQIFRNIHRPGDEVLVNHMMDIVNKIIQHIEIHQFNCINNNDSSKYLLNYMGVKDENEK